MSMIMPVSILVRERPSEAMSTELLTRVRNKQIVIKILNIT